MIETKMVGSHPEGYGPETVWQHRFLQREFGQDVKWKNWKDHQNFDCRY
jgi:hypothetical protein